MLKITIHDSAAECRFQLSGSLEGLSVREFEQSWLTARSTTGGRRTSVDLEEVESADAEGTALLERMFQAGVTIATHAVPVLRPSRARLAAGVLMPALMLLCPGLAFAREPGEARAALDQYLTQAAVPEQRVDSTLRLEIRARLAKSGRTGILRAIELIPRTGRAVFRITSFEGDDMVKRQVIARYLTAEAEARERVDGSLSVTDKNYRFRFLRADNMGGSVAWVYRVEPRKKEAGLFAGEIWISSDSGRVVRHAGRMVKNPSVFVKSVTFTRDFDRQGSPQSLDVRLETRIAGAAELSVRYEAADAAL